MNLEIGTMSVRSILKDADEENLENADKKNMLLEIGVYRFV